MLIGRWR
jgi:hypothetical protein